MLQLRISESPSADVDWLYRASPGWLLDVVAGLGRHEMTPHLPPLLCSLGVSRPERLVEQQGLQQLRTPLTPTLLVDGEAPSDPGGPTLRHLAGTFLSADTPVDQTASTALLLVPVLLVAGTDHS